MLKHLSRKVPCNQGKLKCEGCSYRCDDSSNLRRHRKTCKGGTPSVAAKQKEIDNYKTILSATGNQRIIAVPTAEPASSSSSIHYGDVINGDQINNIQNNNIIVMPACHEDIEHLKKMSARDLIDKIGLNRDISPHVNFFKLVRADEAHPENNTMLLPAQDGQTIHYKSEDGWKTGECEEQLYKALFTDNRTLIQDFSKIEKTHPDFYNGHLLQTVNQMINNNDQVGLKPYFDAYRESLHTLTIKLAEEHKGENVDNVRSHAVPNQEPQINDSQSLQKLLDLEIARQRTHEMSQKTLELEIQKLKLQEKIKAK